LFASSIISILSLNTAIGIYQEGSAEAAAEALKNMLSSEALVVRNGKDVMVDASELVPGDVVKLSLGDRVPADLRMCELSNLSALEAALTGESVPIDKTIDPIDPNGHEPSSVPLGDRHNMCFSATLVSQGAGTGIVIATGDLTEIGTINALVNKVEKKKTNVLEQIDKVSKWLAVFIAISALATWFVAFYITNLDGIEALSTALVSAVAMIPEGLEAIVTMTYAWAVSNMAKNKAIIRALPAVETLGSVTVICSDKTGTLTKNEMTLTAFVTSNVRYRFNVDASERTVENFKINNSFLATRANHSKYLKSSAIIKGGASAARGKSRHGRKGQSFPFGISSSMHASNEEEVFKAEATEPAAATSDPETTKTSQTFDADSGAAPDTAYLRRVLGGGILCSKCSLGDNGGRTGAIGNPTELAILRAAFFGNVDVEDVRSSAPQIAEVPFSSEYKFMATVHEAVEENDTNENMDKLVVHVKGAPDRLIPLCKYQAKGGSLKQADLEPCDKDYWIEQIAILSSHGLRVLALTRGTLEKGSVAKGEQLGPEFVQERGEPWLTIVGLCAIMDPPRPECVKAISIAHTAGVRIAMITGDHKDTALAIGGMLGLVDLQHSEAVTGPEMDAMSDDELKVAAQKYNVFARASPQNKIRIVKALQSEGEVCGMTGDGVNDAPALKAADMGVAMGKEGTDVAREAAEMILADDNFATIVTAVREGRVVWDNLRKVLLVNTPINNAQGLSVLFGLLFGLSETPLSSIQVLYCNLICAVTLGFVTAVEPAEDGIMEQPPRRVGKRLVGRFLFLRIVIGTTTLVACTVASAFWTKSLGYDLEERRAQALNVLSFGAIGVTMSARFARKSAFHMRTFTGNPLAWYAYTIMAVLQVFITYTPGLNTTVFTQSGMDAAQWGIVALFWFVVLCVMELEKAVRNYVTKLKYYEEDDDGAAPVPDNTPLPDEVKRFGRNELSR